MTKYALNLCQTDCVVLVATGAINQDGLLDGNVLES